MRQGQRQLRQWRAPAAAAIALGMVAMTSPALAATGAPGDPAAWLAVALPPTTGEPEPSPPQATPQPPAKPRHTPRAPLMSRPDEAQFAALDWNQLLLGGGTGVVPSFEGSGETVLQPVGGFDGGVGGISVAGRGNRIMVDFNHGAPLGGLSLHTGLTVNQNFARANLEAVDPRVRMLGRRDVAIEAGGFVGLVRAGVFGAHDAVGVNIAYVVDASGEHNSYQMVASADYGRAIGHHMAVNLSIQANFAGDGYARHYFGVDALGAAESGLPRFDNPHGGLKSLGAALVINHSMRGPIGQGLGAYAIVSYTALQGDFAASPITQVAGSADQVFIGAGLGYTF